MAAAGIAVCCDVKAGVIQGIRILISPPTPKPSVKLSAISKKSCLFFEEKSDELQAIEMTKEKRLKLAFRSVIRRHARMLFDWRRTAPLLRAIAQTVRPGDVVVDIGCGLGFLSLAAVRAGAAKVYAIDVEEAAIDFARWQAATLGWEKKIIFFNDHSANVDLPERADLLIQETIGPLAFDENFLPTLQDAKRRFLKPGAIIIPEAVALAGAPAGRQSAGRKKILAKPSTLITINTKRSAANEISLNKNFALENAEARKNFRGLLLWPKIVWAAGCITDASPRKLQTHWGQTFLKGSPKGSANISLTLCIRPDPASPLEQAEILWKFGKGTSGK